MKKRIVPRLSVNLTQAYRLFYPQVPMIIACRYRTQIAAMPANSCMSVSDKPPMFAVSIRKELKTDIILKKSKNFSVNWLNFRQRKYVNQLAAKSNSLDKLSALNVPYFEVMHAPILEQAQAYAICETKSIQDFGDHDLFVGRVIGAMASLDFDTNWKFVDYHPILYLGSNFKNPFTTNRER
jgi:flavin reductase (DIM6/NTAB) family NADH-FMN oxidoreductase RutF